MTGFPRGPWVDKRRPEPKVKASKQELVEALEEIRDRCARVVDARAIARKALGE